MFDGAISSRSARLEEAARKAKEAEARCDNWAANEWWERYELIRNGTRTPASLVDETVRLSRVLGGHKATKR